VEVEVLLLSSRFDLSTDYVAAELANRGVPFLRLNSEDLGRVEIVWHPEGPALEVAGEDAVATVTPDVLRAVQVRRPTFLRSTAGLAPKQALAAHHWLTFFRGLQAFEHARWMNRPVSDYLAENKMVQLAAAARVGLKIPRTVITNASKPISHVIGRSAALKGVDTVLWREGAFEYFGYTTILNDAELAGADLSAMPAIAQTPLAPKVDIRVTIVGNRVWPVAITAAGGPIEGDWRLLKDAVEYEGHRLPEGVTNACLRLVCRLDLQFAALDLALVGGEYFFLELNPLGEWAWLAERLQLDIAPAIAAWLVDGATS
jgi:glutathione synthase/RimK-type ligase-like ATP-grasp enzyme